MNIQRYYHSLSMEELCSGAELILSGEVSYSADNVKKDEAGRILPEYFQNRTVRHLMAEYFDYQNQKKKKQTAHVWVDEKEELIIKSNCGCSEYQKDHYGCAHIAAALTAWYMAEGGEDYFVGTALEKELKNLAMVEDPFAPGVMKRTDSRLLSILSESHVENTLPNWVEKTDIKKIWIHMEPEIFCVGNEYYLELKAGAGRNYVIKDLPAFIRCYQEGGIYSLGKTEYIISDNTCDNFGNSLMKILSQQLKRMEEFPDLTFFTSTGNSKELRYCKLTGYTLGQFLELMDGRMLKFSDGNDMQVELERKGLEAVLRKKTHGASLQIRKVSLLEDTGTEFYFSDEKGIFGVTIYNLEEANCLRQLLNLTEPLYVRESDMPALRQIVFPVFEKYGNLILKGVHLEEYDREKPQLQAYLDLQGKSTVCCTPYAVYSDPEVKYPLFDNSTGNKRRSGEIESRFASMLTDVFYSYDPVPGRLSAELKDDELYQFLEEKIPELQEAAEVFITDRLKKLKVRSLPKLQMNIGVKASKLIIGLQGNNLDKNELEEILSLYSVKKKYFRLKDGTFFKLEDADTQVWDTLSDLYQHHGEKNPSLMKVPLYRALYLNEMLQGRDALLLEADEHYRKLIESANIQTNSEKVPKTLQSILRPYQIEGFHWIWRLKKLGFGGILADDMGLGKTLQVLAFLLSEKQKKKGKNAMRTLIVCPASLVYNWQKELQRFTPELSCTVIAGTQTVRQELIAESDTDVWITSYDLLKRDIALYEDIAFTNEIIDEAQFIKNQHTQASQSVRVIKADFKLALTGTPIENHLGELWSIMDYLMPGFLYSYSGFQKEFELPIMSGNDDSHMERLRKMVHPFILRRLKGDVLKELPEKIEETITVRMQGEQKRIYDAYAEKLRTSLAKKSKEEVRTQKIEILAELTRLRQICCDPSLLFEQYQGESAKLEACMELVGQAVDGGHKILLFSQFTSMLDIICQRLAKEGYAYYRIDGSVSKEKRMDMVESFAYDEVPVFCISLKAGGVGLNLTAADIVIHYDPWWNQAAQNQATDRAHRIGQKNSVSVYEVIAGDTIEEQIQNIKQEKAKLMEDVLSGEKISVSTIEKEDLLDLLS